jgi:hypothetical protein
MEAVSLLRCTAPHLWTVDVATALDRVTSLIDRDSAAAASVSLAHWQPEEPARRPLAQALTPSRTELPVCATATASDSGSGRSHVFPDDVTGMSERQLV